MTVSPALADLLYGAEDHVAWLRQSAMSAGHDPDDPDDEQYRPELVLGEVADLVRAVGPDIAGDWIAGHEDPAPLEDLLDELAQVCSRVGEDTPAASLAA